MVNGSMIAAPAREYHLARTCRSPWRSGASPARRKWIPSPTAGTMAAFPPLAKRRMIIESLLDTDLYKFTMMQVVLHHFPAAQVEYRFKCRTPGIDLTPYLNQIEREITGLCALRFTHEELEYLRRWRFLKSDFVDLLGLFQLDRRFISLTPAAAPGEIDITIKGPWLHTILFEVPVLAIVSEVYFRETIARPDLAEGRRRLD